MSAGYDSRVTPQEARDKARRKVDRLTWLRVFLICLAAFTCTASGRIPFPDDEVSFRTAEAFWDRGELSIVPMDRRTGELKGRPTGSFGVAPGPHARAGEVYSFFGQGLPLLTSPLVGVGDLLHERAPTTWRHAIRGELRSYAKRTPRGDMRRMAVVLSSCLFSALGVCVLGWWLLALGLSPSGVLFASLAYGLGTCAWAYTSTYLSEPLSALCLLLCVWQGQVYRNAKVDSGAARRALLLAAACASFAVHVHILNLLALPFLIAYCALPARAQGRLPAERKLWIAALALGAGAMLALGLSQWWRFGSILATGRFDHYAHWVSPFEGLAAYVVAPGRSIFVYAPSLIFGVWAWRGARARFSFELACVLGLLALRAGFAACRNDWSGGWSLGPRYLVPVLPLLMLPVALAWDEAHSSRRRNFALILLPLIALQAWLAAHSIGEHMNTLSNTAGIKNYGQLSHWSPGASPFAGFWRMDARLRSALWEGDTVQIMAVARLDMLSFGALRLALVAKDVSLLVITGLCGLVGALAGLSLLRNWPRSPKRAQEDLAPESQS